MIDSPRGLFLGNFLDSAAGVLVLRYLVWQGGLIPLGDVLCSFIYSAAGLLVLRYSVWQGGLVTRGYGFFAASFALWQVCWYFGSLFGRDD